MEKTHSQILEGIKDALEDIRARIDMIEDQIAAMENTCTPALQVESAPEPVQIPELESAPEPVRIPEPEPVPESVEEVPTCINDSVAGSVRTGVVDLMTEKYAWRTDPVGLPVRNVLSAISLNDRVLFINSLYGEDPLAFQRSINTINGFESLDQVVAYVKERHQDWDMSSDVVYRFMMAIRRKFRQ